MALSRRAVLKGAAVTGAAAVVPLTAGARLGATPDGVVPFTDPLTWPDFVDGSTPIRLSAVNGPHQFHSGLPAGQTLGYRVDSGSVVARGPRPMGSYLGPSIVVPTGTTTRISFTNAITAHPLAGSIDTALMGAVEADRGRPRLATHLHGGNTSPADDGGPEDVFLGSRSYTYRNNQDAAGLWYHDHALGITRVNVMAGLAGGYIVRDTPATGIDTGSGRWLPAPPYEIPLIIQDRELAPDGSLSYPPVWQPEFFGDVAVVNGTAFPYLDVARGVYRFRAYNGSSARFYQLRFVSSSGQALQFWHLGAEGGLLNQPVAMTSLLFAPGERADLAVDFRGLPAGATVVLTNSAPAPYPNGGDVDLPQLMQFRVTAARGWSPPIPIKGAPLRPLRPVYRLDYWAARAKVRTHSLIELMDATGEVMMVTLNNRMFASTDYRGFPVRRNTLEVWEFANTTADAHPIHLHLVQFQVLNRQPYDADAYLALYGTGMLQPDTGPYPAPSPTPYLTGPVQRPAPHELGWKDTVIAPPGMVTRIAVPFGAGAVPVRIAARDVHAGDYVWHCHILEHEEHDMMQYYRIV